jgi:hypothetical protein
LKAAIRSYGVSDAFIDQHGVNMLRFCVGRHVNQMPILFLVELISFMRIAVDEGEATIA